MVANSTLKNGNTPGKDLFSFQTLDRKSPDMKTDTRSGRYVYIKNSIFHIRPSQNRRNHLMELSSFRSEQAYRNVGIEHNFFFFLHSERKEFQKKINQDNARLFESWHLYIQGVPELNSRPSISGIYSIYSQNLYNCD